MNIPRFSLKHQAVVWMVLFIVTAWGLYTYQTISRREDPEFKIAIALVITIWPGASSDKVEKLVTQKIEDKVEELSMVEKVTSTTRENLSVVFVEVQYETDIDLAWQKLRNKIEEVRSDLPKGIMGPDIMDDFGDITAMIWSFSSATATPTELKETAERLKAELRKVPTVGKVALLGEQEEVIYIEGPAESFTAYSFNPLKAAAILDYQNVNLPSGYVTTATNSYRLEPSSAFELVQQIENAILDVSKDTGHQLRVKDVFSVRRAWKEPPLDTMSVNGQPAIALDVRMKKGYNIVEMGERVREVAERFRATVPPHITMSLVHDQPHEVNEFVDTFMKNLLEGLILVILVMFLSMGLRTAGVIALSLPLSIIMTFALMPLFSVSLETVSIASFIIALGMLVDNAIIIVDNIDYHLQGGMKRFEAACFGAQEVAVPALTGTLATVFAFLPLLLIKEEMGSYIRSLPIVVSLSLGASLVLAVTVTPIIAAKFLKVAPRPKQDPDGDPTATLRRRSKFADRMTKWYAHGLKKGISARYVVVIGALAALVGSIALLPVIGMSFFPEADRDQFTVAIWLPEGSSLRATTDIARQAEDVLRREPDIDNFITYIGKGGPRFFVSVVPVFNTSNYAQIVVRTKDKMLTREMVTRLRETLRQEVTGARITVNNLLMGVPVEAPVVLRITGPDFSVMKDLSRTVQNMLKEVPGTDYIRDDMGEEVPSLRVNIDADAALSVGVTPTEVAASIMTAYQGYPVTKLRHGEEEIPVQLRMIGEERTLSRVEDLKVASQATGKKTPLSAIASTSPQWSQGVIRHFNAKRSISVLCDVHGTTLASDVMRQMNPKLKALQLPPGYTIEAAGEEAERNKAFGELLVVFGIIIAMILLMLVIQFNSIKGALVILFSVPLAIIGALLGLLISGNSFSFMAFLGVVSLAGMVIKNAVVWLDFVEKELAAGSHFKHAIIEAGIRRLRPIFLTAATTIGGLIPLALFGGVLWEGMAWAMVFGLTLATILTLFVIPIIYYTMFHKNYDNPDPSASTPSPCPEPAPTAAEGAAVGIPILLLAGLLALGLWTTPAIANAADHPVQGYIDHARRQSVQVQQAEADLEGVQAQKRQAYASFAPFGMAKASATRLDQPHDLVIDTASMGLPIAMPPMTLVNQNVYLTSFTLTLPLYVGGQRFAWLSAAKHGESARRNALEAVRNGVGFGAAALYVQALQAQRLLLVRQEAVRVAESLLHAAEAKKAVGLATSFDVSLARTRLADARREEVMARNDVAIGLQRLNDLAGLPSGDPVELVELSYDTTFDPDPVGLLAGLRGRPELSAYQDAVAAAEEQVAAVQGGLLPTVALIGEGGYKHGDFGYTEGSGYWQVSVGLQWNLGLDAPTWYKIQQARAEVRKARLAVEEQRRSLELDLAATIEQYEGVLSIERVTRSAVETANQGYGNAVKAYAAAVLPISEVLDAAKAALDTRRNWVMAVYARLLLELKLKYLSDRAIVESANLTSSNPLDDPSVALDPPPAPKPKPLPGAATPVEPAATPREVQP